MTAYKSFASLERAAERMTTELRAYERGSLDMLSAEYDRLSSRVDRLLGGLDCLWSNPADKAEARRIKARLLDAWYWATWSSEA